MKKEKMKVEIKAPAMCQDLCQARPSSPVLTTTQPHRDKTVMPAAATPPPPCTHTPQDTSPSTPWGPEPDAPSRPGPSAGAASPVHLLRRASCTDSGVHDGTAGELKAAWTSVMTPWARPAWPSSPGPRAGEKQGGGSGMLAGEARMKY